MTLKVLNGIPTCPDCGRAYDMEDELKEGEYCPSDDCTSYADRYADLAQELVVQFANKTNVVTDVLNKSQIGKKIVMRDMLFGIMRLCQQEGINMEILVSEAHTKMEVVRNARLDLMQDVLREANTQFEQMERMFSDDADFVLAHQHIKMALEAN